MKRVVQLGLYLDGQRAICPQKALGFQAMGPIEFLGLLESLLGLSGLWASQSQRLVQYRNILEACDRAERFYHRSFQVDPTGTAKELLEWRDQWYLDGWDGCEAEGVELSHRLYDLVDIEKEAQNKVSFCMGQRLEIIHEALLKNQLHGLTAVELYDPQSAFPRRWRDVLSLLPTKNCEVDSSDTGNNDLACLKQSLKNLLAGHKPDDAPYRQDGSVRIVQADTLLACATSFTDMELGLDTVILAESEGFWLDCSQAAVNRPRLGIAKPSQSYPGVQFLRLWVQTLWNPVDFKVLLDFIQHPLSPLPIYAQRILLRKLIDCPGLSGYKWQHCLDEIQCANQERWNETHAILETWVLHPKFERNAAVAVVDLLHRLQHVIKYLSQHSHTNNPRLQSVFISALTHASAFEEGLIALGSQKFITYYDINYLIQVVIPTSRPLSEFLAQAGATRYANHPGALIQSAHTVIWWNMAVSPQKNIPWTAREREQLKTLGIDFVDESSCILEHLRTWLRAILSATECLYVVLPNDLHQAHPVWSLIKNVWPHVVVNQVEDDFNKPTGKRIALASKPRPLPQQWWHVECPKNSLDRRESYTSLELYLAAPYRWLLKYPARLQRSRMPDVMPGGRLFGLLAHSMVERCVQQFREELWFSRDEDWCRWLEHSLDQLIGEEGATLLLPKYTALRLRFKNELFLGLTTLRNIVGRSNDFQLESEVVLQSIDGCREGRADLVIRTAQKSIILDFKWSGLKKYKELIKENKHLQLVFYAAMLQEMTGQWPHVGYFIFNVRSLLMNEGTDLLTVQVQSDDGVLEHIWNRMREACAWRADQFSKGLYEVVHESLTPEENSFQDLIPQLNEAWNEYAALAGFFEEHSR